MTVCPKEDYRKWVGCETSTPTSQFTCTVYKEVSVKYSQPTQVAVSLLGHLSQVATVFTHHCKK